MIAQESTLTLKPSSRRSRTKLRKPRFLRLHLISAAPPPMPTTTNHHKQLINLFPLHPENLVDDQQDKLDEEHNMACIFSSCDDDGAATTLTGILRSDEEEEYTNNPSPSSVNYADEEVELVRTAMRRNKTERDDDDLKWVCYSEVVKEKKKVMIRGLSASSSSSTSSYHHRHHDHDHRNKLVLKLDYEKIMNSWVNKGPLYIHNNNPDIQTCERENGGNEGSWTVPEIPGTENNDTDGGDDTMQAIGSNEMIHRREASVQRYKEKRRNRLFAKTIRYEVRKLNAEKRPRIKGRFVKSN
ncbi:CCT domain-containing protein [Cynara cardunculus var. scolymus]|uniref:CCT domain-containing protein n=1 Tax=Cynara cardunculus var. scolymus TaxID=59895 RepID=A0A103Y4R0_CYNCS|nr:CCT domain-containing protein [Cynara cardunculus var. scolymus]